MAFDRPSGAEREPSGGPHSNLLGRGSGTAAGPYSYTVWADKAVVTVIA